MVSTTKVVLIVIVMTITGVLLYYLLALGKKHVQEHVLFIQSDSNHALPVSSSMKTLSVYDSTNQTYDIQIGKLILDTISYKSGSGKFLLVFSQPGSIQLNVVTDTGKNVGSVPTTEIKAYYPVTVDFTVPSDAKILYLQYSTNSQSISLYKLSVEFF